MKLALYVCVLLFVFMSLLSLYRLYHKAKLFSGQRKPVDTVGQGFVL